MIAVKALPGTTISELVTANIVKTECIDAMGRVVAQPESGVYFIRNTYANGTQTTTKVIKK